MNIRRSIAATLFWLSAAWLVVALAATAYLLTDLYARALADDLATTLELNLDAIAGNALVETGVDSGALGILDPRFARPGSGWYWQIADANGPVAFSESLIGSVLPETPNADGAAARVTDQFDNAILLAQRTVFAGDTPYYLSASGNLDDVETRVTGFRSQALIVLGAVALMLAVMSTIVARFALRPIERLRNAIEAMRQGEAATIKGSYPREIEPLADEVNELLHSNARIIARARNQVGNLAHGLKTPLAVLRNEAAGNDAPLAQTVSAQADRMSELVTTYLDRAALAARTAVVGSSADAGAAARRIVRVLAKLHADTELSLDAPAEGALWFRGDAADLDEILGNICDNACKWAETQVAIAVEATRDGRRNLLTVTVDDDGPGLSEDEAKAVLKRGVRLDEKTPGSGLGLDIVRELIDVYGGALELTRAEDLGGLRVRVELPAARRR